eukprot:1105292-Pyramimonas_sp.AAC.1
MELLVGGHPLARRRHPGRVRTGCPVSSRNARWIDRTPVAGPIAVLGGYLRAAQGERHHTDE